MPIRIEDVPEGGRVVEIEADAPTREAIARTAGLRSVTELAASFDVTRHGRDGLRIAGEVRAIVGQTCVVTLEPIDNPVHEIFDLLFLPPTETKVRVPKDEDGEGETGFISPDADDPPEPLIDGTADLGAIATEFLLLGIDPYPRKSGVIFDAPAAADDGSGPFAALAALKRDKEPGR